MRKLLHIVATARANDSRTLKVAQAFLETFKKKYPSSLVDELNLFQEALPSLSLRQINGKYVLLSGAELNEDLKSAWKDIILHIERFLSADAYLISVPMWNFSIPFVLKHYIDIIVQPRYLFRYTQEGIEGLVKNKKMVIITSRGGDYGPGSPVHSLDYQEPYLRAIFGFVGIADITFINAQPMDAAGAKIQEEKIIEAKEMAKKIVNDF